MNEVGAPLNTLPEPWNWLLAIIFIDMNVNAMIFLSFYAKGTTMMRLKKKLYGFCLLLVVTLPAAQGQEQKQDTQANPLAGINNLFKGVADSLNGAIKQINSAAAEATKSRPTEQQQDANSGKVATTTAKAATIVPEPTQAIPQDSSPPLSATALNGIFAKHPYDGTAKSNYPKVALTVIDWSSSDCWHARARIWWGPKKSEHVKPFKVCWSDSLERAADNAVNYQLFMRQMSMESTGNVRTEGPKAPMMAYPMPNPFGVANYAKGQQAISFIQQVIMDTGWQPGAPTNIWVVKYDTSASPAQAQR